MANKNKRFYPTDPKTKRKYDPSEFNNVEVEAKKKSDTPVFAGSSADFVDKSLLGSASASASKPVGKQNESSFLPSISINPPDFLGASKKFVNESGNFLSRFTPPDFPSMADNFSISSNASSKTEPVSIDSNLSGSGYPKSRNIKVSGRDKISPNHNSGISFSDSSEIPENTSALLVTDKPEVKTTLTAPEIKTGYPKTALDFPPIVWGDKASPKPTVASPTPAVAAAEAPPLVAESANVVPQKTTPRNTPGFSDITLDKTPALVDNPIIDSKIDPKVDPVSGKSNNMGTMDYVNLGLGAMGLISSVANSRKDAPTLDIKAPQLSIRPAQGDEDGLAAKRQDIAGQAAASTRDVTRATGSDVNANVRARLGIQANVSDAEGSAVQANSEMIRQDQIREGQEKNQQAMLDAEAQNEIARSTFQQQSYADMQKDNLGRQMIQSALGYENARQADGKNKAVMEKQTNQMLDALEQGRDYEAILSLVRTTGLSTEEATAKVQEIKTELFSNMKTSNYIK